MKPLENKKSPVKTWACITVVLLYFLGYALFGGDILTALTHLLHGDYTTFFYLQVIYYAFLTLLSVLLLRGVFAESAENHRGNGKKYFFLALKYLGRMYLSMIVLNVLIGIIIGQPTSANQEGVNEAMRQFPLLMSLFAVVLGPIFEEMVFRVAIFRRLREKNYWVATLVSSLLFGLIHVMTSLFTGNYKDVLFIVTYSVLGFWLSEAYEKSGSVFVNLGMHMCVNLVSTLVSFFSMGAL